MYNIKKMLHRTIVAPTGRHTASLIFLHGSGDTGVGVQSWVAECFNALGDKQGFNFNHIKVIYPTAPPQPYTPMNGGISNVWFDRKKISYKAQESAESVKNMTEKLSQVIQVEKDEGIPLNRIIVGGFSMGGSMSLYLGYKKHFDLGGIFALSSFLNVDSSVYDAIKEHKESNSDIVMPELFMAHGNKDELVLSDWGERTYQKLKSLGVKGDFHSLNNYYHELGPEEMVLLRNWVQAKLSDLPSKI